MNLLFDNTLRTKHDIVYRVYV